MARNGLKMANTQHCDLLRYPVFRLASRNLIFLTRYASLEYTFSFNNTICCMQGRNFEIKVILHQLLSFGLSWVDIRVNETSGIPISTLCLMSYFVYCKVMSRGTSQLVTCPSRLLTPPKLLLATLRYHQDSHQLLPREICCHRQSHYRKVLQWEIFMEQEVRFGPNGRLSCLHSFKIFWPSYISNEMT